MVNHFPFGTEYIDIKRMSFQKTAEHFALVKCFFIHVSIGNYLFKGGIDAFRTGSYQYGTEMIGLCQRVADGIT